MLAIVRNGFDKSLLVLLIPTIIIAQVVKGLAIKKVAQRMPACVSLTAYSVHTHTHVTRRLLSCSSADFSVWYFSPLLKVLRTVRTEGQHSGDVTDY